MPCRGFSLCKAYSFWQIVLAVNLTDVEWRAVLGCYVVSAR